MKKLYKYIVFVIGILAFSACADEELVGSFGETGSDVILKLNVQTQANKNIVVSRASDVENMLHDLHIYVFNRDGDLIGYEKLVSGTNNIPTPGFDTNNDKILDKGIPVTIRTKTGEASIYAVANINESKTYFLSETEKALLNVTKGATATFDATSTTPIENFSEKIGDEEQLSSLKTIVERSSLDKETFLKIKFNKIQPEGNEALPPNPTDNVFMMSGYLNDGNPVNIIKVTTKNGVKGEIKTVDGIDDYNVIKLYRILSKNTFTIESIGTGEFTLKSYKLWNVPQNGMLIKNAPIDGNITIYSDDCYEENVDANTFTFYFPENLQPTVDEGLEVWKDREANEYEDNVKSFKNAPSKSAYIELQGDYYDKQQSGTSETTTAASVTYTIHLGDFTENLGDFNVVRNNHYNYKVYVNGVEDIIAEARIVNPIDNPYAEGFVVTTSEGEHYEVDAHYESRVMAFNLGEIYELSTHDKGYVLNIKTQFGSTKETVIIRGNQVCNLNGKELCTIDNAATIFNGEADFEWVRFVKNTTTNKMPDIDDADIDKNPCMYPGDTKRYSSSNTGGWMNVFELLSNLYNEAIKKKSGIVYYTCFIDENYYEVKDWKDFVNKDPRTIQIANNVYVSDDKKSIHADVKYSISQHSIATFYKDDNKVAFGTEIIDEEDRYGCRLGSKGDVDLYENSPILLYVDDWDGFTSTEATNINTVVEESHQENNNTITTNVAITNDNKDDYRKWYMDEGVTITTTTKRTNRPATESVKTYQIKTKRNNGIQPLYESAAKACMSRNRDTNGDGNIDAGEVKWYLASVGQYHALYFAKNSLPVDSWLISDTELSLIDGAYGTSEWTYNGHDYRGKYHYYTSSEKESAGTYWPEEGLTNNPVQTTYNFVCRAELVRCVRTLENKNTGLKAPDKYYSFENNIFQLSGIETRRGPVDVLPNHNELQNQNDLHRSFQVASEKYTPDENYNLGEITGSEYDPCSEYNESGYKNWRTPNQKEVALMLAEMKEDMKQDQCAARTRFSGYISDTNNNIYWHGIYNWHDRVGFMVNNLGNFNLESPSKSANFRCVRDVEILNSL